MLAALAMMATGQLGLLPWEHVMALGLELVWLVLV
jgi:hypothetical protein